MNTHEPIDWKNCPTCGAPVVVTEASTFEQYQPSKLRYAPPVATEDKVALLYEVVRDKFMNDNMSAIITALEGMKWILGNDSVVDETYLRGYMKGHQHE